MSKVIRALGGFLFKTAFREGIEGERFRGRHTGGAIIARLVVLVALLALAVLVDSTSAQAPPVDPQSLVGEWEGQWTAGQYSGRYYLTISKVDGNKVFGKVEHTGGNPRPPGELQGQLDGNVLKITTPQTAASAEFTITGDSMSGSSRRAGSDFVTKITLTKKK